MSRVSYDERANRFDAALALARSRGNADEVLAGMLADPAYNEWERVLIAGELGDVRGPAGSAALRQAMTGALARLGVASGRARSESADLACACVWALGKRDGAGATDALLEAARHARRYVSNYGISTLAAVGDDRAWEEMFARLAEVSRRKPGSEFRRGEIRYAIEYLARAAPLASDRAVRLVTLIRDRWRHVGVQQWLEEWWPGIGPGGPPPETINLGTHVPETPW